MSDIDRITFNKNDKTLQFFKCSTKEGMIFKDDDILVENPGSDEGMDYFYWIDDDQEDYHSSNLINYSYKSPNVSLDEFSSHDIINNHTDNIKWINNVYEVQPKMDVDIKIDSDQMLDKKDNKQDQNVDVVISKSTSSASPLMWSTTTNSPVKKTRKSKASKKRSIKRKRSKSSNKKIREREDSEVPPKRANKRELKCKRKLEETKGNPSFSLI